MRLEAVLQLHTVGAGWVQFIGGAYALHAAEVSTPVRSASPAPGAGAVRIPLGVTEVFGEPDDAVFAVFRTPGQTGVDLIKRRSLEVGPIKYAAVLSAAPHIGGRGGQGAWIENPAVVGIHRVTVLCRIRQGIALEALKELRAATEGINNRRRRRSARILVLGAGICGVHSTATANGRVQQ